MYAEGSQHIAVSSSIEYLRCILQKQQNRAIAYEEAQDVADSLMSFFEVLAEDNGDDSK